MKLLFNLAILFFLSASAFLFFTKDQTILLSFSSIHKEEPAPGVPTRVVEKPTPHIGVPFTPGLPIPFSVTATKTVDKTTAAAGDLLTYTVVINNPSGANAEGISFSDDIDPNTTLVEGSLKASPVPLNDSYSSLGNVGLKVPAASGILVNDYLGVNPQATFTAVSNATTTGGGTISIATDGSFTYTPAAGFAGNDTYQYSLTNTTGTATATITIAVDNMVWFINNTYSGTVADGRLATPFKSITDFQAVNDGVGLHPKDNQAIFVYESATAYSGNITLRNGQKLIGQDATTDLPTILSFTTPTHSFPALPELNSGNATKVTLSATVATNVVTLDGGASGTYSIRGLTIGDKGTGSGISGTNFGTLTVSETSITGTGQAFNLSTGTLNATLANLSSSSGTNGISLTGIAGTLTGPAGALSGHTGVAFLMSGGTGSVTYGGTVAKSSAGNIIDIQNKTGGTVDFNGGITASASGGILLNNNTGATFSFDGGLSLSTAKAAAFTATAGGTVTVTQNNTTIFNQVTTTSGVGINIANTTIGGGGVTFRSVNVDGASRGIILNNTGSGSFSITGTGTTAGSGGTIKNTPVRGIEITSAQNISLNYLNLTSANTSNGGTCDENTNDACNAALYIKNATTVGLTGINITTTAQQGINLNNVTGLTLTGSTVQGNGDGIQEGAIKARNLLGTSTISNSVFKNSAHRIAHIINTSGTAQLTVSSSSFINDETNTSLVKQDCFEMRTQSTAQASVVISNSVFKRAGTKGIQMAAEGNSLMNLGITGCTVEREGTPMGGIEVISDGTATMKAMVDGNPVVTGRTEVSLNLFSGSDSHMDATAKNNTIRGGNNPNGSIFANLRASGNEQSDARVRLSNNTVDSTDEEAILVASADGDGAILPGSTGSIDATVQNNTVTTKNLGGNVSVAGIQIRSIPLNNAINNNCSHVQNNVVTLSSAGPSHFELITGTATGRISLQGTGTNAAIIWNNNGNTPASPPAIMSVLQAPGSTIAYSGVTCAIPAEPTLPASIAAANINIETAPAIAAVEVSEGVEEELEEVASVARIPILNVRKISSGLAVDRLVEELPQMMATDEESITLATASVMPQNITVAGLTLQPTQSLTIHFQVTVNSPLPDNVCKISNQGSVTGTGFGPVLTDDPSVGGASDPTVTVVNDVVPPTITCPPNITVTSSTAQAVTFSGANAATATDNCSTPAISYIPASGSTFPVGTTTVTATATDAAGNKDVCTFTVTIQPPCSINCPLIVPASTGPGSTSCGTNVTFPEITTTGDCGPLIYSHPSGSFFPVGSTNVTVTSQSTGQSCSFTVLVEDNTSPLITCPAPIVVPNDPGQCGAKVFFDGAGAATANDNCGSVDVTYVPASGSIFPVGTTTVTATAADAAGNTATCTFTVTIEDKEVPVFDFGPCGQVITRSSDPELLCGAIVDLPLQASDNCSGSVNITADHGPFYQVGTTVVNAVATDAAGNTATCSFTVIVEDKNPPRIFCPQTPVRRTNDPGKCGAHIVLDATNGATGVDDCDGLVPVSYSPASGSFFKVGSTFVTATATDAAGNKEQCVFEVIVMDTEPPEVSCPGPVSVSADPGQCEGTVPLSFTVRDNCAGSVVVELYPTVGNMIRQSVSVDGSNPTPVFIPVRLPVGTHNITMLTRDDNGLPYLHCEIPVIVTDNELPTITCALPLTINADAGQCYATLPSLATDLPDFADNCTGSQVKVTGIPAGNKYPVGTTILTYTVTDASGNTNQCTRNIIVVDPTPPTLVSVTANPASLWPPNHKMRSITVTPDLQNACGTPDCRITAVTSNEPETGTGDGDQPTDWIISPDGKSLQLRAERGGIGDGRIYTITMTCTDASGIPVSNTTKVYVAHNITAPVTGASFKIGSTVAFAGTFWDVPGSRHTAKWLIDGTTSVKGIVTEPAGSKVGKVTGSYKFGAAGVYKLQMNVTDQNGVTSYANTAGDLDAIVVIYDPNGGYTYGGGYFDSPAGAVRSNQTAAGKVSYGFTVNYFKGATLPKGETQFDFKVGELEYNALNFDYLAISGARAQFKGSGKIIGGQSGINFIMTVIDGQLDGTGEDKVRIKIYNKNTGYVYYDNEPGLSEADNPKTKVGNGSQVVISGAAVQTGTVVTQAESLQETEDLQLRVLPNPSRSSFSVFVASANKRDRIILQVFDQWGRKVEQRVVASELTRIGASYRPGTYFIRVVQAGKHREAKLLKLVD